MSLGQEAKNDENTSSFERLHKDFVSAMKTNYTYLKEKLQEKRFFFVQVFLNKSHCRENFGKNHISVYYWQYSYMSLKLAMKKVFLYTNSEFLKVHS